MNSGTIEIGHFVYTLKFNYNDIDSVEKAFTLHKDDIAAVLLEPVKNDSPYFGAIEQ